MPDVRVGPIGDMRITCHWWSSCQSSRKKDRNAPLRMSGSGRMGTLGPSTSHRLPPRQIRAADRKSVEVALIGTDGSARIAVRDGCAAPGEAALLAAVFQRLKFQPTAIECRILGALLRRHRPVVMNIAHGLDLGSARGRSSGPAARMPRM